MRHPFLRTLPVLLGLALLPVAAPAQTVTDPALTVESALTGGPISAPTAMAFIAANDILVTEKATGRVRRVLNGALQAGWVLDLAVANNSERGLLGMALDPEFATNGHMFLYYTRAASDGGTALDHRIDRFTWDGSALVSQQNLLVLPATPGPNHDGGVILFGPPTAPPAQQKLFAVIGDLNRSNQLENWTTGSVVGGGLAPDDTAAILRVNRDGTSPSGAEKGPFFDLGTAVGNASLTRLYAYGVRNSFGMDFDPQTGVLWNTENGAAQYDEINRVQPGFNSGWRRVMGPLARGNFEGAPGLVDFGGAGIYADPVFSWVNPVAPTAIHFVRGNGIGAQHNGHALVGDSNNGRLYRFEVNGTRDGFALSGDVADGVFDPTDTLSLIQFGSGFGAVTGITTGPDGFVYVLSIANGTIYRIRPTVSGVGAWRAY